MFGHIFVHYASSVGSNFPSVGSSESPLVVASSAVFAFDFVILFIISMKIVTCPHVMLPKARCIVADSCWISR